MDDFELEMIDEGRDAVMPDHDWREQDDDPIIEYQDEAMDELAREARV